MKKRMSRKRVVCAAGALLLTGLSFNVFVAAEPSDSQRGRIVKPIPKADAATLDRGRYIVKTAGCNDCHTPGYAQSAGAVEESLWLTGDTLGWSGPWGTTYPINLRQFVQSVTPEQWLQIARTPARPPMPWFALRDMTDADVMAIYHYVRSLGPAGSIAPAYVPPGQPAKTPVVQYPAAA